MSNEIYIVTVTHQVEIAANKLSDALIVGQDAVRGQESDPRVGVVVSLIDFTDASVRVKI